MTLQTQHAGRRMRPAGLVWATVVLLTACASAPPVDGPPVQSGRLLIRIDAQPGATAHSLSAGFELSGDDARGSLRLSGPLGTQVALAQWQPGEVTLVTPQDTRHFPDLPALSRDALGEDVPLGALPFWLKGQAWPGASSDASTEPLGFVQLGWQIDTSRLQADAQLEARRASPPAVLLRVRLDR